MSTLKDIAKDEQDQAEWDAQNIETLLNQMAPINDLGDIEWEIVDNSVRRESATKYLDNPLTQALLDNKTARIKGNYRADKIRRWADANGYKLHRRFHHVPPTTDFTYIWIEKRMENDVDHNEG